MAVAELVRPLRSLLPKALGAPPPKLTLGLTLRVIADTILVNIALLGAFTLRFFALLWWSTTDPSTAGHFYESLFRGSMSAYGTAAAVLTPCCLAAFYLSGFYSYGRAYRGRYRALIIFQAVTLAYVMFGAIIYLFFRVTEWFPRGVWIAGWVLTLALVGGVRLWSKLWRRTVWAEVKINGKPQRTQIRNVLVIGGAGYVGTILVRKLLKRGYNVTVMDALLFGDDGIRELYGRPSFDVIQGDLRNIEAVVGALRYADAVVHLGGLVGDPACAVDERLTLEINLASTRIVAEAARAFGVQRFIFASSCSVYGASDELLDERSKLDPVSLYARTKLESEKVLMELENHSFSPTILRFGTLYGLSHRPRFDLVVNLLTAKAVSEKLVTIQGGDQWRPFVHVDDAADAVMASLHTPLHLVKGETFNVGSDDQNRTISQVGEMIKDMVPDVEVLNEENGTKTANYRVSFLKIRKYLDFVPQHTLASGITEMKASIEAGFITYRDGVYSNHATLSNSRDENFLRRAKISSLYSIDLREDSASDVAVEKEPSGA